MSKTALVRWVTASQLSHMSEAAFGVHTAYQENMCFINNWTSNLTMVFKADIHKYQGITYGSNVCAAFTNRYNAYVLLEEKAFYYISYHIRIRCYSTFDLTHLQLIIYTWQFGVVNVHVLYCNKLSAICKFCMCGARRDICFFCVISTAVNGLPSISSQLTKG